MSTCRCTYVKSQSVNSGEHEGKYQCVEMAYQRQKRKKRKRNGKTNSSEQLENVEQEYLGISMLSTEFSCESTTILRKEVQGLEMWLFG